MLLYIFESKATLHVNFMTFNAPLHNCITTVAHPSKVSEDPTS